MNLKLLQGFLSKSLSKGLTDVPKTLVSITDVHAAMRISTIDRRYHARIKRGLAECGAHSLHFIVNGFAPIWLQRIRASELGRPPVWVGRPPNTADNKNPDRFGSNIEEFRPDS